MILSTGSAREDRAGMVLTDRVAVKLAVRLPFTKIAS
jgi:hypothetical protein